MGRLRGNMFSSNWEPGRGQMHIGAGSFSQELDLLPCCFLLDGVSLEAEVVQNWSGTTNTGTWGIYISDPNLEGGVIPSSCWMRIGEGAGVADLHSGKGCVGYLAWVLFRGKDIRD